ncbi:uncharacterized protein N7503_003806 [Penicillium pulvis]|uniref:uncharacterized protein n=1 Tax=Penicillium pulvis TaxID=1562058 RepID=UPI002547C811|nr:uncharacterized protein N7503_003806 [Penicillium pulvis]KAJ5806204.1 hypothetical protein N7503_003806 [Penicillium pulvis]
MPSITPIIVAAILGFVHLAHSQTNITASACAASSVYSTCNRDVADKWSSCLSKCNGDANCSVDCGCVAHQEYINCMAHSCWNQVYSCEYQLFVQQYFAICPSAIEPIPFWPAPDDAPNRCSCDLGKVLQSTLTARKEQVSCIMNVTDQIVNTATSAVTNLGNLANIANNAYTATECACCGSSASLSASWQVCPNTVPRLAGADLWGIFFPSDYPNLYDSIPNFAWDSCDSSLSSTDCQNIGFTDPSDKFYRPGDFPSNGTSTLSNVGGTVSAPPSGTVITWSQSTNTWTVTATGYDDKAVASQSEYRATATGTGAFATETSTSTSTSDSTSAGAVIRPGILWVVGIVGILVM